MKKLAVCIPNYNRSEKLDRLLKATAEQITLYRLYDDVEICISDDCSTEDILAIVRKIQMRYPEVSLVFQTNKKNMGMDFNFLNCVLMAEAQYCWIIGNDDLPEEDGLRTVLEHLYSGQEEIDVLVCPFDVYGEDNIIMRTVYPINNTEQETISFHTTDVKEYCSLIERVTDGNALFCFLSNVVFKREAWIRHGDMFQDKMCTIFIQMYMNLQTLKEGAIYKYVSDKFIKNYIDSKMNESLKREYDVLIGLSGVIDYFFTGGNHRKLQECIIDGRINGRMWDFPDDSMQKKQIMQIDSPKNELYKKYFIPSGKRHMFFAGRNVLVYGAGDYGRKALSELGNYNVDSIMVFDADPVKWGNKLEGYTVYPADTVFSVYHTRECVVVVANNRALIEIVELLLLGNVYEIAIIT